MHIFSQPQTPCFYEDQGEFHPYKQLTLTKATALHITSNNGDVTTFHRLVAAGADLEARVTNTESQTALHFAVEFLNVDEVKVLVEAGADVNALMGSVSCSFPGTPREKSFGAKEGRGGQLSLRPLHRVSVQYRRLAFRRTQHFLTKLGCCKRSATFLLYGFLPSSTFYILSGLIFSQKKIDVLNFRQLAAAGMFLAILGYTFSGNTFFEMRAGA